MIALLDKELDALFFEIRRTGLPQWTIVTAIALVGWKALLELQSASIDISKVFIFFLLGSFVIDVADAVMGVLSTRSHISNSGPLGKWFKLSGSLPGMVFFLFRCIFLACAAFLVGKLIPWHFAYLASAYYIIQAIMAVLVAGIYLEVISTKLISKIIPNWPIIGISTLCLQISVFGFFYSDSAFGLSPDASSLKVSLLLLAETILIGLFFQRTEPVILGPMLEIRRRLVLGSLRVEDAVQEIQMLIEGIPEAPMVRKTIIAAYRALSEIHSEIQAIRTAIEKDTLNNKTAAEIKRRIELIKSRAYQSMDLQAALHRKLPRIRLLGGLETAKFLNSELERLRAIQITADTFKEELALIQLKARDMSVDDTKG